MTNRVLTIAALLFALTVGIAGATQNAGPAWNQYAGAHDFGLYPAAPNATFEDIYSGDDIVGDLAAMEFLVSEAMGIRGGIGMDDTVNFRLQNWGPGDGDM